jgi:hypothetical protein
VVVAGAGVVVAGAGVVVAGAGVVVAAAAPPGQVIGSGGAAGLTSDAGPA